MANYWAIAIGINQYQSFQPLIYAQRDAQLFRDFLITDGGFEADHCLLMTDVASAPDHVAYPSRGNIQARIVQICQQILRPGDLLWCFFSGYGVQFQGKDYLMPVDSDPLQVEATGIPMESIYRLLNAAPTDNIIMVLDINRSQSTFTGEGVGAATAALAKQYGIATLLSCLPEQFSHETLALRQGLFTSALVEAIRYQGCVTLEQLEQYLGDRLPQLSEHHWRPRQEPLTIIPSEKAYLLIVPEQAAVTLGTAAPLLVPNFVNLSEPAQLPILPRSSATALLERSPHSLPSADPAFVETDEGRSSISLPVPPATADPDVSTRDPFIQKLLSRGGIIALILLLGVVLRNCGALTQSPKPAAPIPKTNQSALPASFLDTTNPPDIKAPAGSPLAAIVTAIDAQQFEAAKQQIEQLPAAQRQGSYNQALEQIHRGLLSEARSMINRLRQPSQQNQASDFVEGIKRVRQIKAGQPFYKEAQQDIDRWSRVILDMAQGRAGRNNGELSVRAKAENFNGAIASARLIPPDRPELYNQAQQAVGKWSQAILDVALASAAEGNLDEAIVAAEMVPSNTPVYPDAQEAIAGWRNQTLPDLAPQTNDSEAIDP
ncbi:MAG: caspase family protein [Cyanobacteria bacterium CAN_BIN43]|nr:caspase family protein [Cyanobacteria bacterium CAN_BIN43]